MSGSGRRCVREKKEDEQEVCPVCGGECGMYFMSSDGEIVGCERCVRRVSAREYNDTW